jgi:oxygen-dependent protoporphyrinogen oxidase
VELGLPVRELRRAGDGWRLAVGSADHPRPVEADAVVLALPARPAARLLDGVHAGAAGVVGGLDYASVALVTMALPEPALPDLSGLLVPATEGTAVKAATFFTTKWGHLRSTDGLALVRASLGRYGDEQLLQRADGDLVATAHAELSRLIGRDLPEPAGAQVQRWGGALPQYRPGHADRVAAARADLAERHPTLALAGAGYDGVGIPICIRSGQTAADHVLKALGEPL